MWNAILVAAQRTLDVFAAASAVSHIISKIATVPIIKPASVANVIAADDKNEKPVSDMRCECSTSQLR
jgi:hypothetical protein